MMNKKRQDAFSYFSNELNDSDISDDDDDDEATCTKPVLKKNLDFISKTSVDEDMDKASLPKPTDALLESARPDYLQRADGEVDWEKLTRREVDVSEMDSHAVPPPEELALKEHTLGQADYQSMTNATSRCLQKRPYEHAEEEHLSPPASKKKSKNQSKNQSFQTKEKRKRDLGMQSRGKSYVEEEKRILRQQYDQ